MRVHGHTSIRMNSLITIPFRAVRFAAHMVALGHSIALLQEVGAEIVSFLKFPEFKRLQIANSSNRKIRFKLESSHRIAIDSPDTQSPHGAIYNWKTNKAFVLEMVRVFGNYGTALDLGCSTGRLVKDFDNVGWSAVGLEGSGAPERLLIGPWKDCSNTMLFSCDIGKPFSISDDAAKHVAFDVVTAFDVVEHLDFERLKVLAQNIRNHTKQNSRLIITTDNSSEMPNGIELHVTRWSKNKWVSFFKEFLPEFRLTENLSWWKMVRRSARGLNFQLIRYK